MTNTGMSSSTTTRMAVTAHSDTIAALKSQSPNSPETDDAELRPADALENINSITEPNIKCYALERIARVSYK